MLMPIAPSGGGSATMCLCVSLAAIDEVRRKKDQVSKSLDV